MAESARDEVLTSLLKSDDLDEFECAIELAHRLGDEAVRFVALVYQDLDPSRQIVALSFLGEQESLVARTVVFNSIGTGDAEVRVAALNVLPNEIPDIRLMSVIAGLGSENDKVRDATMSTLRRLSGDDVDSRIVELLESNDSQAQVAALQLIAARQIDDALPKVKELVDSESPEISLSTWTKTGKSAVPIGSRWILCGSPFMRSATLWVWSILTIRNR